MSRKQGVSTRQLVPLDCVQRDVLVIDGDGADERAYHLGDARRPHAGRIHDELGLDRPVLGLDGNDSPVAHVDSGHERMRADLHAEIARGSGDRIGGDVRIDVAVARHPDSTVQRRGCDLREQRTRLLRADELRVEADRVRAADAAAQLEEALGAGRDAQAPDRVEHAQLLIQLDAVAPEAHHGRGRVELRHEPGGVVRRPARQVTLLDKHNIAHSRLREVVRAADAGDSAADDDGAHARTRSPFGSYNGSERTSPETQSPKMSTPTTVPGAECSRGTYANTMLAPTA